MIVEIVRRPPCCAFSDPLWGATVLAILLAGLAGCERQTDPAQVLAAVNGKEITVRQVDEEMQRADVRGLRPAASRRQLLERLIDRQLLQDEAAREKIARDPRVIQVIDRARAMIVAEAYLQKRIGKVAEPGPAAIADYYEKHPELFSARRQFDMRQLVFAASDLSRPLDEAIRAAQSLDDVAAWMDTHRVAFSRTRLSRSTAALPANVVASLSALQPGQLLVLREGSRAVVVVVAGVRSTPVTLEAASGPIARHLLDQETRRAFDAEFRRLRAGATIEYAHDVAALK